MAHLNIYTYGGGEILSKIFNVVSVICGSTSEYGAVIWMAVNMGLIVAIFTVLNTRMQIVHILKQWLIPVFLTLFLFTTNSQTVIIHDFLVRTDPKQKTYKVDHVPLLLSYTAYFFSSVSYGMTKILERTAHLVNDRTYNWTGQIWAGKTLFNTRKIKIIDEVTEENFRNFCKECVFRDLGLGTYSKEELSSAPELLKFLVQRTSKIRGYPYKSSDGGKEQFLSCHNAISKIRECLRGQLANSKEILMGSIGNEAQYLFDKSANAPIQRIIEQQIAIDTLKNYTAGRYDTLAAKRAQQLQIESQKILGAMGANILLASRNYFEALIYGIFPLVIIVSLISLGFKVLLGWIQIMAWISFWPPCFVIANFILDSIWESKKCSLGLTGSFYSLTMSEGIFDLYNHMEAIACGIFLTIPLLSWGILYLSKGGASAIVHWASNFTGAAQSSASVAASEEVTGNYNYKNVALASQSLGNITHHQRNMAPTFRSGSISTQDAQGTVTTSLQGDHLTMDEKKSNLMTDIAGSQAFTASTQKHLREAESATRTESATFSDNIAHTANTIEGINKHTANASNLSEGWDKSNLSNMQRQAQEVYGKAEEYGKANNLSTTQTLDEALRIGLGEKFGLTLGVDGSTGQQFGKTEADQNSNRYSDALSIYDAIQSLSQTINREGGTLSAEEGFRDYMDFSESFNRTKNTADQLNASYTKQKGLEQLNSDLKSEDLRISENLNNQFIRYLDEKYGDKELIRQSLSEPEIRKQEIENFIQDFIPKSRLKQPDLQQEYTAAKTKIQSKNREWEQKIDAAQSRKSQWAEKVTSDLSSAKENLFGETENLEILEKIKNENLGKFNPDESKEQFANLRERAHSLKPQGYDEKGNPTGGEFLKRKEESRLNFEKDFYKKSFKKSVTGKTVGKALDGAKKAAEAVANFLAPQQIEYPDHLTEEQKQFLIESRYDDLFP